eukprot:2816504-Ditylum_brightwellii.AAC.1
MPRTNIASGVMTNSPIPIPTPAFASLLSSSLSKSPSIFPEENTRSLSKDEDDGFLLGVGFLVVVVELGEGAVIARS